MSHTPSYHRRTRLFSLAERIFTRLTHKDPLWLTILLFGSVDVIRLLLFRIRHRIRRTLFTRARAADAPLRVAFVLPWFGAHISGGAESETYGLVRALQQHAPEIDVDVFTTTLHEFSADWNAPVHTEGVHDEEGIRVHRFHAQPMEREAFHFLNGTYLMQGGTEELENSANGAHRSPLCLPAEAYFIRRMIMSKPMLQHMEKVYNDYDAFILIPYMFASTVLGSWLAGRKALVIPCLHPERYAYMRIYAHAFTRTGAMLCHVRSEAALCARMFPKAPAPILLGEQVDTNVSAGCAQRFRDKYNIQDPFLLYAGRQIKGKNLPLLVQYFTEFRDRHPDYANLKLVLIGKGDLDYAGTPGVIPLGFIPAEDKVDAYRAALCMSMLSDHESFSIVLMESWLQETPVLVSANCAVTRDHVEDSGGGLLCANSAMFSEAVLTILRDEAQAATMGRAGRDYVLKHYTPEIVVATFRKTLQACLRRTDDASH